MKLVPLSRDKYGLQSKYDKRIIDACKAIPGIVWNPTSRMWEGYTDGMELLLPELRKLGKVDDAVLKMDQASMFYGGGSRLEAPRELREYQKTGLEFLCVQAGVGCILADDMGLGKTCQAIYAWMKLGGVVCIVCPAYVKGVWRAELAKWFGPSVAIFECKGKTPSEIPKAFNRVVICNYDVLDAWKDELAGCELVIFDEAHNLQNEKSKRSKAAREIASKARFRIGLTGTPMTNRPKDLWNVVDTLCPGRFGNFFQFGKRYCGAHQKQIELRGQDEPKVVWDFDGSSNVEELGRRLKYFMLRRTKEDVKLELPDKTRQVIRLEGNLKHWDVSSIIGDKRLLRKALDIAADAKFPEVCKIVQGHAEAGHRVVLFCHRKAVAEAYAKELSASGIATSVIHGEVPEARRRAALDSPPEVLCCTVDSCGTGISLTFADVAVFGELLYEPHKLLQAEARLHRFGQGNNVLIQYVVMSGSAEEFVVDKVVGKLDTFTDAGLGGGDNLSSNLSDMGETEDQAFTRLAADLSCDAMTQEAQNLGLY